MRKLFAFLSVFCAFAFFPNMGNAAWGIVDALDLSPFVPIILDAFMSIAMAGYEFFVGNGDGIIYLFVWGWLAWHIATYAVKMYIPKSWLDFFGMDGGGMWSGTDGWKISEDVLKPCIRGIVAAAILLPLKPQYITNFVVDPFLQFGGIYTSSISEIITQQNISTPAKKIKCPDEIIQKNYISAASCEFMVQPVADITAVNNTFIKRGMEYITSGLTGLMTIIPNGANGFMDIITGVLLVSAFTASNFFMALLIIQGIFNFGMALIMYPFKVVVFVSKKSDDWVNPWPAFDGIIDALKKLVITMIACMFILAINIAAVRALFNFNKSVFVVAAGGSASSNLPSVATAQMGFGGHSVLWLSTILTFFLMFRIFELTKKQLLEYTGKDADAMYKKSNEQVKKVWKNTMDYKKETQKIIGWFKKDKK
ncbi:MAG: hypothetical protein LBL75_01085 [Rickettsiales bacterium]|nr:hypothetical protein [Rickettsiales bacterium]